MASLNNAILSVYESALDLDRWAGTLDSCVSAVDSYSATMMFLETSEGSSNHWGCVSDVLRGLDPGVLDYYNKELIHHEKAAWEVVQQHPKQTLISDTDVTNLPDSALMEREEVYFMYHKMGILRRVAARLNSYPMWSDSVAFQFGVNQSKIPLHSMESISLLLPHIAKSIEMGRSFDLLRKRYNAVLSALDFVDVGMCIALPDGTVIVSNAAAQRIYADDDGLKLGRKDTLQCRSQDATNELAHGIRAIAETSSGSISPAEITLSIERVSGHRAYLVELSPLRDACNELGQSLYGTLIMIIDPENSSVVNVQRLGLAYSLTPAELGVARLLVDGWTVSDIAEQRNVSAQTVKTQTASIMRKTETSKRSELIRLALKLSPPIRSLSG